MHVAVFSTKVYDRRYLEAAGSGGGIEWVFFEPRLGVETARLAEGCGGVCAFVNDGMAGEVLGVLSGLGVRLIALRCAGYNHVDLEAAGRLGMTVARVPAYSPHAVAEHTVALMLTLNRKTHRAFHRVREGNFSIEGLMGFDLVGKTVGVIGLGQIGSIVARIMVGFGCEVLGYDPVAGDVCEGVERVGLDALCERSDVVTLHCPLTSESRYLIDGARLERMKRGVMVINTSRGGLIETRALIGALKCGAVGAVGLDVYEEEADVFFEDHSGEVLQDDVLARLLTFPNVLVTSHQAFFTHEAVSSIAETTVANIRGFEAGGEGGVPAGNMVGLR